MKVPTISNRKKFLNVSYKDKGLVFKEDCFFLRSEMLINGKKHISDCPEINILFYGQQERLKFDRRTFKKFNIDIYEYAKRL